MPEPGFSVSICCEKFCGIKISHIKAILTFIFLFGLSGCTVADPFVGADGMYKINVFDASSREIYLRIKITDYSSSGNITLIRNGSPVMIFRTSKDTVICDTSLSPNTTYSYQIQESHGTRKYSEKITASTLSPASHNVNWQIYYIGQAGFDVALDVAMLDENNIWVSGRFTRNEAGIEKYYNLVKWDGSKWTEASADNQGNIYGEIYSLFALSKSEVWAGNTIPGIWDGKKWKFYGVDEGYPPTHSSIKKIWGTGPSDMYFASENGALVKYNGKSWKLLNEGADAFTADIWGYKDALTGEETVYCPYSASAEYLKIIRVSGKDQVDFINLDKGIVPFTVWTNKGYPLFVGGSGVFFNRSGRWTDAGLITDNFINKVRGNGLNDIFAVGEFGLMAHYNGIDWKVYPELEDSWGTIRSIDVKGNTIAAAGILNNKVAVVIGKRK